MSEFYIVPTENEMADLDSPVLMDLCAGPSARTSGRKERVVIACVTLGVPVVVDPAVYYHAERIHLLHRIRGPEDPQYTVYGEFYDETCRRLRERLPGIDIVEHDMDITDYTGVLRELLRIVRDEEGSCGEFCDMYVNVSSGTPEYSAAAMLVCMQYSGLTAFSVRPREYALKDDSIRELLYRDGRPVGLALQVCEPEMIATFDPERQDMDLVTAMAVINEIWKNKNYATYEEMIGGLVEAGVWRYSPDGRRTKTPDSQKRLMYFRRTYLDPMKEKGWLVEDPVVKKRYKVTEKGQAVIDVYYRLE